jgi:hypothetical protein
VGVAMLLEAIASAMPDRPLVGRKADVITAAGVAAAAAGGAAVLAGLGADAVGFLGVSPAAFPACLFASAMAGPRGPSAHPDRKAAAQGTRERVP